MSQDEIIKQVLLFKDQGNQKFKDEKFFDAEVLYTKAIDLAPQTETKTLAILYTNRAFANYKLENYGSVLNDTTKAIKCDPTYFKAYYRRGSANLILGNYEDALNDFKKVVQMKPKDRESRDKLKQCKEALVLLHFSQAIENDDDRGGAHPVSIVLSDYVIEDDYKGPKMENDTLTLNFVLEMLEHFKNQKTIHKRHLFVILQSVKQHFEVLPNITRVTLNKEDVITVCGDVHGQFYDLLNLFNLNGTPSEKNQYLFNGDFVDRGSFSCEVIITLLAFKCLYPNHFFMSRGNHESKSLHKMYGFEGEVFQKYGEFAYNVFCDIFNLLPLGHLLNEKILVIHGGLFGKDGVKISDIDAVNRRGEPPVTGLMSDLLWADPQRYPGRMPSKRGVGSSFGPDVTKKFLDDNNLELIIRSHEVRNEGYEVEHDGLLITVFSAPNYCDQFGNKGACIRINGELQKEFITFTHVPHPPIPPMAYASNLFNF